MSTTKKLKKGVKITLITIVSIILLIIASLIIIPIFFKEDIFKLVKTEINTNFNAQVDFKDIDLSLFKHFPDFTLSLDELQVVGIDTFKTDTLLSLKQLTVTLDLMSVIKGDQIKIKNIGIYDLYAHAIVLKSGQANWDIVKPSKDTSTTQKEDTTTSKFSLSLKKLIIENANMIYDDQKGSMYAQITNFNNTTQGDFTTNQTTIITKNTIEKLLFQMGSIQYLNDANIELNADIDAHLDSQKFVFKENLLRINTLKLVWDGFVQLKTNQQILTDIKLKFKEASFKDILSLIPSIYTKNFNELKTGGNIQFDAFAKGIYDTTQYPSFGISLNINDAYFQYPSLPTSAKNIFLDLKINNPGGTLNNTKVNIRPLRLSVLEDQIELNLYAHNLIKDPFVDMSLKGGLLLENIAKVYHLEGMNMSGRIDMDIFAKGLVSTITNKQYDKFDAHGDIRAKNFVIKTSMLPDKLSLQQANIEFSSQYVKLTSFIAQIGKTDLNIQGAVENFFPYYFGKGILKGNLNIVSNTIDVNPFLSSTDTTTKKEEVKDTTSFTAPTLPKNMDLALQLNIKNLYYDNMTIKNINGSVTMANDKADLSNLSFSTLGANATLSGLYNIQNPNKPITKLSVDIKNLDIQQAAKTFNSIAQLAPVLEKTSGTISTKFNIIADFDKHFNLDKKTAYLYGNIQIPTASIEHLEALEFMGNLLKNESVKNPTLKNVNISFEMKDGKLYTKPTDMKIGNYNVNVEGFTSLENQINYVLKTNVPFKDLHIDDNTITTLENQAKQIGMKLDLNNTMIPVSINISGNTSKPTIKANMEDAVIQQKEIIKQQINDFIAQKTNEVKQKAKEEASKVVEQAKEQGKKEVQKALKGLFGK